MNLDGCFYKNVYGFVLIKMYASYVKSWNWDLVEIHLWD